MPLMPEIPAVRDHYALNAIVLCDICFTGRSCPTTVPSFEDWLRAQGWTISKADQPEDSAALCPRCAPLLRAALEALA